MRSVRTKPPWGMYVCIPFLIAGAAALAEGRRGVGVGLVGVGYAWFFGASAVFARRVHRLRRDHGLTPRDRVEIEYPTWTRRAATGYLWLLALVGGITLVGAVVLVVVLAVSR